jgi:hypothetical protein
VIVEIGLVQTLMWRRNFHRVVSKVRESHYSKAPRNLAVAANKL